MDMVMANISAKVLIELAEHIAASMKPGGVLVASGVLQERGDEVKEALSAAGLTEMEIQHSEDWLALVFQR